MRGIVMKVMKWVVASVVMGAVSFSALAAKEVTKEEVKKMNLEKIGTVNTTAETTSPMDAKRELSKMADEKGGKYYRVIAGREHGKFSATADVYK
ncbi:YdgH/BhsA/McbA family protein [Pantoea piersonii]